MRDAWPQALSMRFLEAGGGMATGLAEEWIDTKVVPFTVIAGATAGAYRLHHGDHVIDGPKDTFVIGPPHVQLRFDHRPDDSGSFAVRFAHISFTLWGSIDPTSLVELPERFEGAAAMVAGQIIEELLAETAHLPPVSLHARRLAAGSRLLALLLEYSRPLPGADAVIERVEQLGPVLRFMRENLSADLDVQQLASYGRVSRASLHRQFLASLGVTPIRYLKGLRLDEAAQMLLATNRTISHVATSVGFVDRNHFAREFAVRFGATPTVYRRSGMFTIPPQRSVSTTSMPAMTP